MQDPGELTWCGAAALARRIAAGEVSAREAVEAYLGRIDEVNPRLNALVVSRGVEALAEADAADARRGRGEQLGLLHGVPVTVKESFDLAGTPTTAGLAARAAHRARVDSVAVRRLRQAGAIILGKTNLAQALLYNETDNPLHGLTLHPTRRDRSPGGSSGGEAALIAARGSALGIGSDIGGSLRAPAHACGIQALKPTSGRLSLAGEADEWLFGPLATLLAQPGPMARRVEDLALALRVLSGPAEPVPALPPPSPLGDPGAVSLSGLRIAMWTDDGFFPAAPALRRAVREAAAALAARGAQVDELQPPGVPEALAAFLGLLACDGGARAGASLIGSPRDARLAALLRLARLPAWLRAASSALASAAWQPRIAFALRAIRALPGGDPGPLLREREGCIARFTEALDRGRFDAILCPPHALPALLHGATSLLATASSYLMLFNLLGMPAGVVAATAVRPGEESDRPSSRDLVERRARAVEAGSVGLPVGVQVAARPWREDVVLAVMTALEQDLRPPHPFPETRAAPAALT